MSKRILFICTGNTCRSPMAEGLLRQMAQERGADIQADSAGTSAVQGQPVIRHAVVAAREALAGTDISAHRAKRVTPALLDWAEIVLCMENHHLQGVLRIADDDDKYTTLHALAYDGSKSDIADPYGGSLQVYRMCADEIYQALQDGWDRLI